MVIKRVIAGLAGKATSPAVNILNYRPFNNVASARITNAAATIQKAYVVIPEIERIPKKARIPMTPIITAINHVTVFGAFNFIFPPFCV